MRRYSLVPPLSLSSFGLVLKHWGVLPQKYDKYACPHCASDQQATVDASSLPDSSPHLELVTITATRYRACIDRLPMDWKDAPCTVEIVAIMDFARVHELGIPGHEKSKLSIFTVCIILDRKTQICFDVASHSPQTFHFMTAAFSFVAEKLNEMGVPAERNIVLWSDGGLRNYGTLQAVSRLQQNINRTIRLEFFAPYHGHSRCDAHFGNLKKKLRYEFPHAGPKRTEDVLNSMSTMKNTESLLVPNVELDKKAPTWSKSSWNEKGCGVKSWNIFLFKDPTQIVAYRWKQGQSLSRSQYMPVPVERSEDTEEPTETASTEPMVAEAQDTSIQSVETTVATENTALDSTDKDDTPPPPPPDLTYLSFPPIENDPRYRAYGWNTV